MKVLVQDIFKKSHKPSANPLHIESGEYELVRWFDHERVVIRSQTWYAIVSANKVDFGEVE